VRCTKAEETNYAKDSQENSDYEEMFGEVEYDKGTNIKGA
jgi:hypothetical protein